VGYCRHQYQQILYELRSHDCCAVVYEIAGVEESFEEPPWEMKETIGLKTCLEGELHRVEFASHGSIPILIRYKCYVNLQSGSD
jgi:hypothetical protein